NEKTTKGNNKESTKTIKLLIENAKKAPNGDKSDADRVSLQQEFTAKVGELNRIASTTTFGGRNLLDGSFSNVAFQIGANANETISFGMTDISSTALKGNYKEAAVDGAAMTGLAATATGTNIGGTKATVTGTPLAAGTAATDKISINGVVISLTATTSAATAGAAAATEINKQTALTGVTAKADATSGELTLTSKSAITVDDAVTGSAAKLGLTPSATPVAAVPITGATVLGSAGAVTVNGNAVAWTDANTIDEVLNLVKAEAGAGAKAEFKDGRVILTSGEGKDIKLANTTSGSLSQLGLSAGTSQAKLTADTSIDVNGVEVKFKKGDTSDAIVASINSASTGVQASKNADGTLNLFADKDITIKDGSAGTGLAALGLTTVASNGTKTAVTMETSVSDLSILTAASSQQAIQALDDAMQQIDSQRSQLGAVQNR
ncbi:flagellin hook IN motif-containing protein, partial [Pseudomonas sp. NPDC078863]|uniref:flagellin hook IN motif-containing protein n=1 Tax=Pseudomonas sp. NPDC078863 TaxID=3364425 RepID=UPI0037CB1CA7